MENTWGVTKKGQQWLRLAARWAGLVTRPNEVEREEAATPAFMAAVAVRLANGGLARL
jgi:hypothetical protein